MTGPDPAVAALRVAVRAHLGRVGVHSVGPDPADASPTTAAQAGRVAPLVCVACSGGADSLALAAALAFEAPRAGFSAGALVVDHGLQDGSARVAARAAEQCAGLGLDPVEVLTVRVAEPTVREKAAGAESAPSAVPAHGEIDGGPEARARAARYAALDEAATRLGARAVFLGHTRDDQAEQVLLGLARGSGTRSLAGMPSVRGVYRRPLLGVPREQTVRACEAAGLTPWSDPHNADDAYRRVRARALLARAEAELGPGIAAALARSADLLRADADALDGIADAAYADLAGGPWPVAALAPHPQAVRTRLWLRIAREAGVPPGRLTARHVHALDRLLTAWRGQGPVVLPGAVEVGRRRDVVLVTSRRRVE